MAQNQVLEQLDSIKKSKTVFSIFILLFVVMVLWVGISVFTAQKESKLPADLKVLAKPLDPNLNSETLIQLQEKQYYQENELEEFTIYKLLEIEEDDIKTVVPIEFELPEEESN